MRIYEIGESVFFFSVAGAHIPATVVKVDKSYLNIRYTLRLDEARTPFMKGEMVTTTAIWMKPR